MRVKILPQSIVARATTLTIVWMFFLIALFLLSLQTPLVNHIHKRVIESNANSLLEIAWLLETSPTEMQPFILSAFNGGNRSATLLNTTTDPQTLGESLYTWHAEFAALFAKKPVRFRILNAIQLRTEENNLEYIRSGAPIIKTMSAVEISIPLQDQQVLQIRLAPALVFESSPLGVIIISILIVLSAPALAVALSIVLIGPIKNLQRKSEQIRLGDSEAFLADKGPIELRGLTHSVNEIRVRLNKLIREREMMVSAIAHDVRTGLTRLRLRFDEKDVLSYSSVKDDVQHLETLTADMLAYARAENMNHHRELVRLNEFVDQLVSSLPFPVNFDSPEMLKPFDIVGDPVALRRMFDNLLENARRYGNGIITVRTQITGEAFLVNIVDNGPGIPNEVLDSMFEPFQRLESSRNRLTGGTGLGLGIARAIARAHGAILELNNREYGGLIVSVIFPLTLSN